MKRIVALVATFGAAAGMGVALNPPTQAATTTPSSLHRIASGFPYDGQFGPNGKHVYNAVPNPNSGFPYD